MAQLVAMLEERGLLEVGMTRGRADPEDPP
jgi:hypothetical protein